MATTSRSRSWLIRGFRLSAVTCKPVGWETPICTDQALIYPSSSHAIQVDGKLKIFQLWLACSAIIKHFWVAKEKKTTSTKEKKETKKLRRGSRKSRRGNGWQLPHGKPLFFSYIPTNHLDDLRKNCKAA
ncbi:hypothetical protein RRG08_005438 [Elysia crispata]|uniref:Uncharacterized protein n=1 Tax=Elysia crispata TaxID=231223 RepID=A0AAE0Y1Y3_9GAST|nr:hypothetical protein RRG08_005438 [Elysia crispata]